MLAFGSAWRTVASKTIDRADEEAELDLGLSSEQTMFSQTLERFLAEAYDFERRRSFVSSGQSSDLALWQSMAELGCFGLFVSEAMGGYGGTVSDAGVVMHALGRVLCTEPVVANALVPLRVFEAAGLLDLAEAVMEGRSRPVVLTASNVLSETDLSGVWRTVSGAPQADSLLVLDSAGNLFKVAQDAPGVTKHSLRQLDGQMVADVVLDHATGEQLARGLDCMAQLSAERMLAGQWYELGSMQAALAQTTQYVAQRRQFGKALGDFQSVQQKAAEMAVACEEGAAAVVLASRLLDASASGGDHIARACRGAQIELARTAQVVAATAVQLHGGMGVSDELPIAAHYRQMITFRCALGSQAEHLDAYHHAVVSTGAFAQSAVLPLTSEPEVSAFRDDVRAFLAAELPEELRKGQAATGGVYPEPDVSRPWQRILAAKGWAAPAWPASFGGAGWTGLQRFIFETECALAGAPVVYPIGIRLVAPVVQAFGTDEQKRDWLPKILSGEDYWCQGFSEPGAGSDLASLATRAEAQGDEYLVNGSKIWTTHAHHANRIFALVRTQRSERRQQGITALAIDLDAPGVEVRPIISIGGDHDVNEVFFTDVRVPMSNRIGAEGQGWDIAKYLLEFERGTGLFAARLRSSLKRIAAAAEQHGWALRGSLGTRFAELVAQVDSFEMLEFATLATADLSSPPGPVASVLKLRASRLKQDISQLGIDVLGVEALRFEGGGDAMVETLVADGLNARAASIFGGASEIQLSIIARTLAGL
jgi:alkylation response protein AidB-like acyl-CoA dehydrogenase